MEEKRFTLRMSNKLFEKIKEQAERNKRSVAKEIEYLLEQYFMEREKEEQKMKEERSE